METVKSGAKSYGLKLKPELVLRKRVGVIDLRDSEEYRSRNENSA